MISPSPLRTLLLLAVGIAEAAACYAQPDFYLVGPDIAGQAIYNPAETARFKFVSFNPQSGISTYEWSGASLGTGFKINDGGWNHPDYNLGGSQPLQLRIPYTLERGEYSGDINFEGYERIHTPTVTLLIHNPCPSDPASCTGAEIIVDSPDYEGIPGIATDDQQSTPLLYDLSGRPLPSPPGNCLYIRVDPLTRQSTIHNSPAPTPLLPDQKKHR